MSPAAPVALTASPSPFPLDFDQTGERLFCIDLSESDFRAASFLDERLLAAGAVGTWLGLAEAARTAGRLSGESDYIFHIGHVGSTLVSRLLGGGEWVFALREPAILRTLARQSPSAERLHLTLRLLSRVWRPSQRALIKATSFVSDLAPPILAASPTSRALLIFVAPQIHIASRLAGPATRAELPRVAQGWLDRLHARLGAAVWRLEALSEGERAAAGWTCEVCALAAAAKAFADRVRWLEFESFLADPAAGLTDAVAFLRGPARDGEVAAMLGGGDLGRYAKAPEHPFDAATRRDVVHDGLRQHAAEVARGLAWIEAAANAHPVILEAARLAAAAARAAKAAAARR